jgi:hypothetical protein
MRTTLPCSIIKALVGQSLTHLPHNRHFCLEIFSNSMGLG